MYAVKYKREIFIRLIIKLKGDINLKDKEGNTALHLAVYNQDVKNAYILLIKGANFEIKNDKGYSPFDLSKIIKNKRIKELFVF